MKTTGSKRIVNIFSVNFNPIDSNDILDIHKHLIKKQYKTMLGLIKKIFIGLSTGIDNGSNHTQYTSLSNQK